MRKARALSILRHTLTFVGGLLVANGKMDEGMASEISGAIIAAVGAIWGWVEKPAPK